ncbi:snf7 family protein, putative [Ichthyophthirius multifiliis]|uniref:Snf7 family protein, putative n=1 Tax=Ichthyophthirius multifiliis TaxID=5932 RepID=G0QV06_ICHMU|nr:snf7 family protein, putative [Ichthyophthirius multifiliis]EGR30948.1 snf7 family protein, putative [Ichthyophthirius multifiliis]|eukprot:XP_004032535.1 snf7 family protein, putative [Ichthyophthirius multifiliis]
MGGKQPVPEPPQPKKTVKEMVKEFSKTINRLKRDFQRELMKLEFNQKKITNDIKAMIKKKEPRSTIRIIVQQQIKNNAMINKYKRLDAQLSDVLFQLNSAATSETLCTIMKGMGDIMKAGNSAIDIKNIQMAIETFAVESEKQNVLQEQMSDIMNQDEEEMGDEQCDKLIDEMEKQVGGGGQGGNNQIIGQANEEEDFEKRLEALK